MKTLQELEAMSDDELRVMLAELNGYALIPWQSENFFYFRPSEEERVLARDGHMTGALRVYDLPDYPSDLNACHEVEKTMSYQQHCKYADCLNYGVIHGPAANKSTFATARQRTIALILTMQQP